ncbi:hypothetical protein [Bordetella tumbae]|uniref:hypothetical protein n=1 Tax=Bordetella tumbae TaxID=1649139 RepID=UPI0039F0BFA4
MSEKPKVPIAGAQRGADLVWPPAGNQLDIDFLDISVSFLTMNRQFDVTALTAAPLYSDTHRQLGCGP